MDNSAVLSWVVSHYKALSPVLLLFLTFLYKIVRVVFKAGQVVTLVCQRILAGEDTLHKVATNHLPHLQLAMEESNRHLVDISETLKELSRRGIE